MGIFSIVFKMTVNCVHSLESPQGCHSIDYTQYTFCNMKKKKTLKLSQTCRYRSFSTGLKNEFETAVVTSHQCSRH